MNTPDPTCPYCNLPAVFLPTSSSIYNGRDYGPIWKCTPCDAYVGVHKGTRNPLGRLANKELRAAKQAAHRAFDPLWKDLRGAYPDLMVVTNKLRSIARSRAYRWLALQLDIRYEDCHVGMFDLELCERTVLVIQATRPTSALIRQWFKAQVQAA